MAVGDKARAARRANDLQDAVGEAHAPKLKAAIKDAMLEVARDLPTRQRPDVPLDHFRRVQDALEGLYRAMTKAMASEVVGDFKSGFGWLETKADEEEFYERLYEEYLYIYGLSSISSITETTRQQIVKLIESGLKQGHSIDEIADEITKASDVISETRAHIIARTETHSAAMFASMESARRSTVPLVKEWVSVEDGRVRDFGEGDGVVDDYSHRAMNEVQVPLDDPFEVPRANGSKEPLMFPGDPNGSAGNIINCRCAMVYDEADLDEDADPVNPVQREPGGPQFRYLTVGKPKASTAALNAFITENGIADVADLKGITAATLREHIVRFLELKERFGLDPMIAVGPASRFIRRGGRIQAVAAVYPVTNRETGRQAIWHMPTTFGKRANWERQIRNEQYHQDRGTYAAQRVAALAKPNVSDEVRNRAARMDAEGAYWGFSVEGDRTIPDTVDGRIRAVIDHEFGHVVHLSNSANPTMGEDINRFLSTHRPTGTGWNYLVSKYGGTNPREYVAETFSLYMRGDESQYYRIHPELLAIYQRYDRASGVKAVRLLLPGVFMQTKTKADETDDPVVIIQTVLAAAPEDRAKVRRDLLANYPHPDKDDLDGWIDEALALEVVDTI